MQETPATSDPARRRRLLALLLILPIFAALTAVYTLDHAKTHRSLLAMTNFVGPSAHSLLQGNGLTVCTEDVGTPGNPICFHAARMPASAVTVALGIKLFGDRYLTVAIFKTLLLLLPVELAIFLVWQRMPAPPARRLGVVLLLLAPFAIVPFLADVSNMLVDEGYSYSFLALALALLFFPPQPFAWLRDKTRSLAFALTFALSLDGLYLSKSSMLPAVFVLLAGFLVLQRRSSLRIVVLVLVAAAPLGWALHQHHASGRYSFGTSFDGFNLHKGNNEAFLQVYPPRQGDSIDWHDRVLNQGRHFNDEWSFNDFHWHAALAYLRTHPRQTLQGDLRKFDILFLSFRKYGSSANRGMMQLFEELGLLLFRLIFWTAILSAACLLIRPKNRVPHLSTLRGRHSRPREPLSSPRPESRLQNVVSTPTARIYAAIFLATVFTCTLPYLAGFAYTRHVSILIYPSALFCCTLLCKPMQASQED